MLFYRKYDPTRSFRVDINVMLLLNLVIADPRDDLSGMDVARKVQI